MMQRRHWIWVAVGLLLWVGLVYLWSTGPHMCEPPGKDYKVVCGR